MKEYTRAPTIHGKEMTIYFYTRTDEYGDFCNFSLHGFELSGRYWLTVEHYFQAQKFAGTEHEATVHRARTPGDAKAIGRNKAFPLRDDWEVVKDEIMRQAVLRKFETHADIRERLLNTGDEELVENAPGDYYWGCGLDGTGLNRLGTILMDVRETLRTKMNGID
jgi:ribA/ribD-fused uncharacterized protein